MSTLGDALRDYAAQVDDVLAARDAQAAADADEILRLRHALEEATRPPQPAPQPPTRATHVIAPGDTYWSLAQRYGTTVAQLTAWNPGVDPRALTVGSRIHVGPPLLVPEPGPQQPTQPEPEPVKPAGVVFSVDIGNIPGTPDAAKSEAEKISGAKKLLGVTALNDVRVFFRSSVPRWDDERIKAMRPGDGDTILVSTLSRDWAGLKWWLDTTPDAWVGKVRLAHGHEREADLITGGDKAIREWLDGCQEKADLLDAADGYTTDDFVKIGLYYSQAIDPRTKGTRERFYGGQDFGIFGEDCYHPRAWLSRGKYATPPELFDGILDFAQQIGRPTLIAEWGGERAKGDDTGQGRAKAILDGGNYLKARNGKDGLRIIGANWWHANGKRDGQVLHHHLDAGGPDAPEVAAYRSLIHG